MTTCTVNLDKKGLTAAELPAELDKLGDNKHAGVAIRILGLFKNRLGPRLPVDIFARPTCAAALRTLAELHLGGNGLEELPESIGTLVHLTTLSVQNNELVALPESLGALRGLTSLDAGNNRLVSVPAALGARCASLRLLELSGNALTHLPASLGRCGSLQHLGLRRNPALAAPPADVVAQGLGPTLAFLRARDRAALMMQEQTIASLSDGAGAYWTALVPWLHVSRDRAAFLARARVFELAPAELASCAEHLRTRGYFDLPRARLRATAAGGWAAPLADLARGIERLMEYGWSALWIMVYDEVWALAHQLSAVVRAATGGANANNFDVLAWHVDPKRGQKGFSPHRDRMNAHTPEEAAKGFAADGAPKYVSAWLPLTDATCDNSCLYVLPATEDPGYHGGDAPGSNPLAGALAEDPTRYQHIRALPRPAGTPLLFSHRLIHWGAATNAEPSSLGDEDANNGNAPRVAVGFAFSADDYEAPYLPRTHLPLPPVELRVALAAAQAIVYHKRLHFGRHELALFNRIFSSQKHSFDARYAKKIRGDYQWAKFTDRCERAGARRPAAAKKKKMKEGGAGDGAAGAKPEKAAAAPPSVAADNVILEGGLGLLGLHDDDSSSEEDD